MRARCEAIREEMEEIDVHAGGAASGEIVALFRIAESLWDKIFSITNVLILGFYRQEYYN